MKFDSKVETKYRNAIEEAVETILERGNKQQKNVAKLAKESDLLIRFVPLDEIGVSGVTGVIDNNKTNARIKNETLDIVEALGEIYITFSDWCLDVAGQRGCQGTFVHEGLHAYDFAKIISTFSKAEEEPENIYDLTLYELEHRAAVTSGDYLVRIGKPDFIDDGLQLNLVSLDKDGKPFVDMEGIKIRMQNGYGLNESEQGVIISKMLGLKPRKEGFFSKLFG
ncbi:MAG TPA: hypothetical protein PKY59_00905 [Pyrinomonadaceae bacterium]|nr:hypothetical protein [Pyrinomonadaceae bacterium]